VIMMPARGLPSFWQDAPTIRAGRERPSRQQAEPGYGLRIAQQTAEGAGLYPRGVQRLARD
jgi:hypothetical protein